MNKVHLCLDSKLKNHSIIAKYQPHREWYNRLAYAIFQTNNE
jgi:hypothetical protein